MTGWDIQVDAVRGVLNNTAGKAGDFQGEFTDYFNAMVSAAGHAGTMQPGGTPKSGSAGPVGAALSEFVNDTQKDLAYLPARSAECINATVKATQAYIAGDLQMAADAQSSAQQAPQLPDLTGKGGPGK
ncbi:DUF6507 family protein [Kitasatospora sp. LaBMicrA B282]|uniref:DUF6507 family protein n=1 Tax=Kitasatospora sp. LaBMicrA B282 TaxID=3420949 RepID=UPI003D097289